MFYVKMCNVKRISENSLTLTGFDVKITRAKKTYKLAARKEQNNALVQMDSAVILSMCSIHLVSSYNVFF